MGVISLFFYMRKIAKYVLIGIPCVLLAFYLFNFEEINYGGRQLKGQLKIIFNTTPVEELLASEAVPDSVKHKIRLIEDIKKFTVDSLGLNPSGSYQKFYDQKGEPILWVITASPPYSLDEKKWKFPVVGEFSYKGHFERDIAEKEARELKEEGYDVRVGEVSAWSTLGYLNDPILSSMVSREEGDLAALIIHELTHGTLFVKNDIEFNENLADFIGDEGAQFYLKTTFGDSSEVYLKYLESRKFGKLFSEHITQGSRLLDSLYQTFSPEMASIYKDSLKYDLIDSIMLSAENLLPEQSFYRYRGRGSVNNAFFTAYKTYQGKQDFFKEEMESKFNNNFRSYLAYLKTKYSSL